MTETSERSVPKPVFTDAEAGAKSLVKVRPVGNVEGDSVVVRAVPDATKKGGTCTIDVTAKDPCRFSLTSAIIAGTVTISTSPSGETTIVQVFAEDHGTNNIESALPMPLVILPLDRDSRSTVKQSCRRCAPALTQSVKVMDSSDEKSFLSLIVKPSRSF